MKIHIYYLNGEEKTRSNSSSYTFNNLTASTQYTIKVEVYNGVGIKGEDSITISTSAKPGLSADEIQQKPATYYGAEVKGYTCSSNGVSKWRIYYADESNIYLIADDYIASSNAPRSRNNNALNVGETSYSLYFTNILNDYTGSSWINQNSLAKKWLNTYLNSYGTSTNNNIKAVAYIMDTNVWSIYAGSNAEYAIGAPTIELFCASYKDTHPDAYIECDSVTSNGYYLEMNTGETSSGNYVRSVIAGDYNNIYINDGPNLYGMWIASPSSYNRDGLIISTEGFVGCNSHHMYYSGDYTGLRPIVCLKSSVYLEAQGDGTYAIVQ